MQESTAERLTASLFDGPTWWYNDGVSLQHHLLPMPRAMSLVERLLLVFLDGDESESPIEAYVFHDGSAILVTESYWDVLRPENDGRSGKSARRWRGGAGLFGAVS